MKRLGRGRKRRKIGRTNSRQGLMRPGRPRLGKNAGQRASEPKEEGNPLAHNRGMELGRRRIGGGGRSNQSQ
eukprot:12412309-Karenia_brevis.AAC.1